MRLLVLAVTGVPWLAFVALGMSSSRVPPVDVAVARLVVERDSTNALRAVADTCLEHLVSGLTARGITVARHARLSAENLGAARPARWAVLGRLEREAGQFQAELHLLEVASGEELRSYFNADKEPAAIGRFGEAASVRIATVIREQKEAHKEP